MPTMKSPREVLNLIRYCAGAEAAAPTGHNSGAMKRSAAAKRDRRCMYIPSSSARGGVDCGTGVLEGGRQRAMSNLSVLERRSIRGILFRLDDKPAVVPATGKL